MLQDYFKNFTCSISLNEIKSQFFFAFQKVWNGKKTSIIVTFSFHIGLKSFHFAFWNYVKNLTSLAWFVESQNLVKYGNKSLQYDQGQLRIHKFKI